MIYRRSNWRGSSALLACVALALAGCGSSSSPPEKDLERLTGIDYSVCAAQSIIILFDRTTRLSRDAADTAQRDIRGYLDDEGVVGGATVIEIGASLFKQRTVTSECLGSIKRGKADAAQSGWMDDHTKRELDAMDRKQEITQENANVRAAWQVPRTRLYGQLERMTKLDAETRSSEIASALVEEIGRRCSGRAVCRVILFSDMLDTSIDGLRRGLAIEGTRPLAAKLWAALGPAKAPGSLDVTIWGIGRDDRSTEATLSITEMGNVVAFWKAFLNSLPVAKKTVSISRGA